MSPDGIVAVDWLNRNEKSAVDYDCYINKPKSFVTNKQVFGKNEVECKTFVQYRSDVHTLKKTNN
jgi:hypothetical protein